MKKIGILFGIVALMAAGLYAATQTFDGAGSPPYVSQQGALMLPNSALSFGVNAGDQAGDAIPASASCAITKGEVVILDAGTTYPVSVSKTTTVGSLLVFGVALNTVTAAGDLVYVRTKGIARTLTAVLVTKGNLVQTCGTAGKVSVTAGYDGVLSRTANVGIAVETTTAAGSALIFLQGR